MRRLFSLGLVAAVLVLGDVAAKGFVDSTVTKRAQQDAPKESKVSASIGAFPFVPPLLLAGEVRKVEVRLTNIKATVIVFAEVRIDLRGVEIDRGRLLNDRKARITAIDHGKVTATITEKALSDALLGAPVRMADGEVTVAGARVTPSTRGGKLSIAGITVPANDYVPCASDVEVKDARLEVSCEIDEVPAPLLDAVQDAVDRA